METTEKKDFILYINIQELLVLVMLNLKNCFYCFVIFCGGLLQSNLEFLYPETC
jgi:hypothetical protein